jgi:thiamine biosynthesis protein ThiS
MNIFLNNLPIKVSEDITVEELIAKLGYIGSVAVFVNDKQLLMSQYKGFLVSENDRVLIIKPLGGG